MPIPAPSHPRRPGPASDPLLAAVPTRSPAASQLLRGAQITAALAARKPRRSRRRSPLIPRGTATPAAPLTHGAHRHYLPFRHVAKPPLPQRKACAPSLLTCAWLAVLRAADSARKWPSLVQVIMAALPQKCRAGRQLPGSALPAQCLRVSAHAHGLGSSTASSSSMAAEMPSR